ncbi:hypothetical protein MY10362_004662 [Beauveria mimosiformis]
MSVDVGEGSSTAVAPILRRKHVKKHVKPLKCAYYAVCKFQSAEQRELDRHMQVHLPEEEKTVYKCKHEGCTKAYSRSDKLAKHEREKH